MEHVEKCKGGHSPFTVLKGRGQNICAMTPYTINKAVAANKVRIKAFGNDSSSE